MRRGQPLGGSSPSPSAGYVRNTFSASASVCLPRPFCISERYVHLWPGVPIKESCQAWSASTTRPLSSSNLIGKPYVPNPSELRLLVVEDDDVVRAVTTRVLLHAGHAVLRVNTLGEAREALQRAH